MSRIKGDIVLIFILLLVLILSVYYVGFVSDTLVGAKVLQQLGFFLTGRTSSGGYPGAFGASVGQTIAGG